MKRSMTLQATESGTTVANSVRNQEEAYMDVWKLCVWKWVYRSGSSSCKWITVTVVIIVVNVFFVKVSFGKRHKLLNGRGEMGGSRKQLLESSN